MKKLNLDSMENKVKDIVNFFEELNCELIYCTESYGSVYNKKNDVIIYFQKESNIFRGYSFSVSYKGVQGCNMGSGTSIAYEVFEISENIIQQATDVLNNLIARKMVTRLNLEKYKSKYLDKSWHTLQR